MKLIVCTRNQSFCSMFVNIDCAPNVFITSESYSTQLSIKDSNVMSFCSANRTACIIKDNFYIIVTKLITFIINFFYITVFYPKTFIWVKFCYVCVSDKLFKLVIRRALIPIFPNPIFIRPSFYCFFQIGRMTKSVSTGICFKIKSTITSSFIFIFTCDFSCTFLN